MIPPKITVQRIPIRSAIRPAAIPPRPVPIQVSAPASATADRSVPSEAAIGFRPTTMTSGEPKEIDRIASVTAAAAHDAGLSMLSGKRLTRPVCGGVRAFRLRSFRSYQGARRRGMPAGSQGLSAAL
jgi:hypothetical protein